jgi:hypothetical protein
MRQQKDLGTMGDFPKATQDILYRQTELQTGKITLLTEPHNEKNLFTKASLIHRINEYIQHFLFQEHICWYSHIVFAGSSEHTMNQQK